MTYDELAEYYVANHPGYTPNRVLIGRFAKKLGYRRAKQVIKGKQIYFYVSGEQHGCI